MLKVRILTAIVGIPLAMAIIYWGNVISALAIVLLAVIGYYEYLNMSKEKLLSVFWIPGYVFLFFMLLTAYAGEYSGLLVVIGLLFAVFSAVIFYPKYAFVEIAYALFGAAYVGGLFSYAMAIGYWENHFAVLILAFLLTWGNDTGGYVFGRLWGVTKLVPELSPKKTVIGSLGGLITATLVMIGFEIATGFSVPIFSAIGLVVFGSIAAQLGDLLISLVKRTFAVKDAGFIFPGHGGVLDRFDSFLLVIPLVYFFFL